ncbi:MAG TPA: tetratricopeptide repeat protein [Chroococcales cyanobacterium]
MIDRVIKWRGPGAKRSACALDREIIRYALPVTVAAFTLWHAPAGAQNGSLQSEIGKAEKIYFGTDKPDLPAQQRLRELERSIYGKAQKGTLAKRAKKIRSTIGEELYASLKDSKVQQSSSAQTVPETTDRDHPGAALETGDEKTPAPTPVTDKSAQNEVTAVQDTAAPSAQGSRPAPSVEQSAQRAVAHDQAADTKSEEPPVAPRLVLSERKLLQQGAEEFKRGHSLEAEKTFHDVLVHNPENVDALFNLGAISERRGDLVSALNYYRTAAKLKPDDLELKQAVASIQHQFSRRVGDGKSSPLVGALTLDGKASRPPLLQSQLPIFSAPNVLVNPNYNSGYGWVQPSNPPLLQVSQSTPPVVHARNGRSPARAVLRTGLSAGLFALPGPLQMLHCPLCSLLSNF